nr:SH3 domain-containing protein [Chloroflexia bacterium]
ANGYTWWQLRTTAGTGWAVENWLTRTTVTPAPQPPPPASGKFVINDTVRVTESLNLRSSASTSASRIATLAAGTTGTVVGGPASANGYTWWQLRTSAGTGWAVENWLTRATATTPPPSGFPAGTTVQVVDAALNLRDGASTSNRVLAVLPQGTRLSIVSGPQSGSGYSWYQVRSGTYGTGWVVSTFLRQV